MTDEAEPEPDDTDLWPLVQVLGDIARRVEREEMKPKDGDEKDEVEAA